MSDEPFIKQELRPDLTAFVARTAAPDADAPPEELGRIAKTVLSEARRSLLGLDDDEAAFAGGVPIGRSPDVVTSEADGEAVLLNLETGAYFSLNPIGAVVWEWLEQPHALDAIAAALSARYEVHRAKASEDVARMLVRMRDRGLIVVGGRGA
jgi:hypothetical protein